MADTNHENPIVRGVSWAAATLRALAECGMRTILLTAPEGAGAAHAGNGSGLDYAENPGRFLVATAGALASRQRSSVLVVQADGGRPDRQRLFGPPPRGGVWELVHDLYLGDLTDARVSRFGLGDWLEVLGAQGRTGELVVREGDEHFRVSFVRGSIREVETPAAERDGRLGRDALHARTAELLLRLVEVRDPVCRFMERPAPRDAAGEAWSCLDRLFHERLREQLRHPCLDQRVAGCLTDTPLPNFKLLASGGALTITPDLRRPLEFLIRRLGRGFDLVLIDAPRVSRGTGVLAALADATLLIAGREQAESAGVVRAVEDLRRWGAGLVGVVNDQPGEHQRAACNGT